MSRFPIVPRVPFVATLLAGCSASSSSPIVNGTPPPGPPSSTDVVTYHYDNQRSGENLKETTLNPGNVNSATFGKVGEFAVDGQIDGQTRFLSQLAIPGQGNARDLTKELYDSNQAAANRDHFSAVGGHFITPMVATGRVYVGTATSVAVFGLR